MKRRSPVAALALSVAAALVTATGAVAFATPAAAQPVFDRSATATADAFAASDDPSLLKSPHDVLFRTGVHDGTHGLQYITYDRTYRGMPVVGGDVVIMTGSEGTVLNVTAAQDQIISVDLSARVSAGQALSTAVQEIDALQSTSTPRLVVLAWGTPRLAWEVNLTGFDADGDVSVPTVYIDAVTGEVAEVSELVVHGTGNGFYSGNVTFNTSGSGTSFSMLDPTRPNIRCGGQDGATFTGNDDVWGNGSGTSLETACVDVMYAVQRQWDMLGAWLNRNGINGTGGGFPARVGWTAVNASWNGSNTNFGRTADGQRQVTPMDVVAHEYGHAIFQTTPGGSSSGGTGNEKPGLNEATSDIFGALTEHFANNPNDPPDFLVGEQANLNGDGPIRFMYNPSLRAGHPNCYSSAIPTTSPVHAAGGPLNHWFYLVSQGSNPPGGPASPICAGGPSSVTGVGILRAGQIYYNALLQKTTSWRYINVRVASLNAAVNMFGANSPECVTVRNAWNAVSVPAQPGEPTCGGTPPPPPPPGGTIYQDSFETSTGWSLSGNATAGIFERGAPQATSSGGVNLQLSTVPHGSLVAVTGRLAGTSAGDHDVDGGVTTITSPSISIPSSGTINLLYSWTFAHLNNATSADFFRVSIISGGSTTVVHNVPGAASNRAGSWQNANISLNNFRGSSIQIRVEVADNGTASLIEGAIDNVRITQS